MPKLNQEQVETVEAVQTREFQPIPPGRYVCRLLEVEEKHKPGSEYPYWKWTFQVDGEYHPDQRNFQLFENTSLNPKAAFRIQAVFKAFQYSADTDTEEIIDDPDARVVAHVVLKAIPGEFDDDGAPRKNNGISKFAKFDPAKWEQQAEADAWSDTPAGTNDWSGGDGDGF